MAIGDNITIATKPDFTYLGTKDANGGVTDVWGRMVRNGNTHITQTNPDSRDGLGAHVTTQAKGGITFHDKFDRNGNLTDSDWDF